MAIATPYEYSDWITYGSGTQTRLDRLRLHIKEVSDLISSGNYSLSGTSNSYDYLQKYLDKLMGIEEQETKNVSNTNKGSSFVKGRPRR